MNSSKSCIEKYFSALNKMDQANNISGRSQEFLNSNIDIIKEYSSEILENLIFIDENCSGLLDRLLKSTYSH